MKKILFLLMFSQIIMAQKIYELDYQMEYKEEIANDSTKSNYPTYFINSKNNNHLLVQFHQNNTISKFSFVDKEVLMFDTEANELQFTNNDIINITCDNIFKHTQGNKEYDYNIKIYNDTIMDGTSYYHYAIEDTKKVKRKKIKAIHYIITKENPDFQLFMLYPLKLKNSKKKEIPNGIIKMKYFINGENKITSKVILEKMTPIHKKIIIPEDCTLKTKGGLIIMLK
ncbi:hypothetical protein ACFS5J_10100 [Flavobacterium chuncheonense]|uniref:Uncharacterized protein n=1 Tax=Flavobacterium chuncheonense TaxID=2026653 RepID=A0ABW5YP15_9FLAO